MFWCLRREVCLVRDEREKRILGCSIYFSSDEKKEKKERTNDVYVAKRGFRLVEKVTDLEILWRWDVWETFFGRPFLQIVCVLGENT